MKKYLVVVLILWGFYYYLIHFVQFPDILSYAKAHPEASWAPSADYYSGLIAYMKDDYPQTQAAMNQLVTDYPQSSYKQKALFYLSGAAQSNHDFETAKMALQQYEDNFPNGNEIEIIRRRLELLKYEHP